MFKAVIRIRRKGKGKGKDKASNKGKVLTQVLIQRQQHLLQQRTRTPIRIRTLTPIRIRTKVVVEVGYHQAIKMVILDKAAVTLKTILAIV